MEQLEREMYRLLVNAFNEGKKQERRAVGEELALWMSAKNLPNPYRYVDRMVEAIKLLNKGQALKEE